MSRHARTILLTGGALLACAAPAVAAAPTLTVHSIFSGDRANRFHVGAEAMVLAKRGAAKMTQVCVDPAPVVRPACSPSRLFAPSQEGTTKIEATFADGQTATTQIHVARAATKVGGPVAVPGHAACDRVQLYGNYDPRTRRFRDRLTSVRRDTDLALYNRVGADALFVWDYKADTGGFVRRACAKPGLVSS
jgi:hypothetical protein